MMGDQVQLVRSNILGTIPFVRFAMSTRLGGVSPEPFGMNLSASVGDDEMNVTRNRELFFHALGVYSPSVAQPNQVHGGVVRSVRKGGRYSSCDALVTNVPGVFLAVSVADCIPVLMVDRMRKVVAAVHAGWKGTLERIVENTIVQMEREYGTHASDISAFIGPGAAACCYEVGPEVSSRFNGRFVRSANAKVHLDLKSANEDQLLNMGVRRSEIEINGRCTICNPSLFHSFRRDREKSGRMLAVIGIVSAGLE
jgi:YfiH family protein